MSFTSKFVIFLIVLAVIFGLGYVGYNYVIDKCGTLSPLDMLRCIFLR